MAAVPPPNYSSTWKDRLESELRENILPFWVRHAPDPENGGFIGGLTEDMQVVDLPRSAVVTARILWTFSQAALRYPDQTYRDMADRAYQALVDRFVDPEFGGVYWQVTGDGKPSDDVKMSYAQAFAIYGLSEYHRLTANPESLNAAKSIFDLLESRAADIHFGGYREGWAREGQPFSGSRVSADIPECRKSMNTMLHVLEAYTNLLRVWPDANLRTRHGELLWVMLEKVLDSETGHFRLFFTDDWTSLNNTFSYGHDIEGAWLLREAAHVNGDAELIRRSDLAGVQMAHAVLKRGVQEDGSIANEGDISGIHDRLLSWWAQAEGVVGFYDAFQVSGEERFRDASERCWSVIERLFIDRQHGDWRKTLQPDGSLHPSSLKIGPWECPYHHARACFEMLDRLS